MTPDCALYYDPDYSEVYGWAESIQQTERCKVCGDKCDSTLANGEDFYCDPCWQDLECCTDCGTRIFEGEVKDGEDYFHETCMENAEEAARG